MSFCPNLLLGNSSKNSHTQTLLDPGNLGAITKEYNTHTHTHMHTGNHRLPNLSKFILCWTDTRTSVGVHFHRRCDLNCLSLKLSLIVLTVLLYSNGQGVAGFMWSYSYSRKQGSERPCSPSPAESTHTDTRKHRLVI